MALAERSSLDCDGWMLSGFLFDLLDVWRINDDFSTSPLLVAARGSKNNNSKV